MILVWNEIRDRAVRFARQWAEESREAGEYQTFWNEFFEVFGVHRRSVAIYQKQVAKLKGGHGFIDVFWPGTLVVEHKSAGQDLDSAFVQAGDYLVGLPEEERPRYVIVSDYRRVRLYDLESGKGGKEQYEFPLSDLPRHIRQFAFMAGYEVREYKEEDPVNRKAVRVIVDLYRALETGLYEKEYLSRLLVRLVFCFFADDTGIFPKDAFHNYFLYMSREDGGDFGPRLGEVFQTLNTPENKRQKNLDEDLASLPYVNGSLFADPLPLPSFNREMRKEFLKAAEFDWGAVSPAIFGSMFQFVMDADGGDIRHDFGAHYTSEKNILKVIDGLFLDELRQELEEAGQNRQKLTALWEKIGGISLLDPACGCGNFLVVAYRELRHLELEIIKRLYRKEIEEAGKGALPLEASRLSKLSVERMFGIEILEFPAEIARVSLWLVDHLANKELGELFGKYFAKLPLVEQPHILPANALETDWENLVPKNKLTYILGNPPFIAKQDQNKEQKGDMARIFGKLKGAGELDYVSAWYMKATEYIQGTNIKAAFVSTNSITQGEQVGILWGELLRRGVRINFAHRTFKWTNEAPGKAAVYCVIIGFGLQDMPGKRLFDYEDVRAEPHEFWAKNINPYLVDADDVVVKSRRKPLCPVPAASFGSMPNDGGLLLFADEKEKDAFLLVEPDAAKFIKPFISAKEYLNGNMRYCLWLKDAKSEELRAMPAVMQRIRGIQALRETSKRAATRELAKASALFGEDRQPETDYVLIPLTSSERRVYIPLSIFGPDHIAGNTCAVVPNATMYHFGVLQSLMHMAWMRSVCGRLKSDYRYSNELVYNNFPWPEIEDKSEKWEAVFNAASSLLNARKNCTGTLADMYDPLTMPKILLDAHKALDAAVDRAYATPRFASEPDRLKFLFSLYKKSISGQLNMVNARI